MAGCSRGVGQGGRYGKENGGGLPCRTGPALQPPSGVEGHLQGPLGEVEGWRDGASKGCMKRTNDE